MIWDGQSDRAHIPLKSGRARINEFIRSTFVRAGWVLSEAKSIFDNNVTELPGFAWCPYPNCPMPTD